jgi:hypothetical protein
MKLFVVLFALSAYAMAEAVPNLEARAGCSQRGQYCNGGTFLCCPGQGSCSGNVVSLSLLTFPQIWSNMIADSWEKIQCKWTTIYSGSSDCLRVTDPTFRMSGLSISLVSLSTPVGVLPLLNGLWEKCTSTMNANNSLGIYYVLLV